MSSVQAKSYGINWIEVTIDSQRLNRAFFTMKIVVFFINSVPIALA